MGELKPCPFCNCDRAYQRGFLRFECPECGAQGPAKGTKAEAITAWNTRPRTEGRGEGQPVAWAYEYTNHLKGDRAPGGWLRAVAFEAPTRARVNAGFARNVQPLYASPIREPEISRDGPHKISDTRKWLARQLLDSKLDEAEAIGIVAYSPAITDLAPVGGRGEEGSSQSQPVLSPKSDTEGPSAGGWVSVEDRFPGEQGFDSGNVLVFINGHCDLLDMTCRQGGAWGIRLGWFDVERQAFRVGGTVERQVTHWCDLPNPPERRAVDDGEADHTGQLRDEPSSSNLNEESQTNGS